MKVNSIVMSFTDSASKPFSSINDTQAWRIRYLVKSSNLMSWTEGNGFIIKVLSLR